MQKFKKYKNIKLIESDDTVETAVEKQILNIGAIASISAAGMDLKSCQSQFKL